MEKIKFFETKRADGSVEKSFGRLNIAWYFWSICFPGSLWVLYVLGDSILRGALNISDGGMLVGIFVVLQLGWIAPKQLAKMQEVGEFLTSTKK